MKMSSRARKDLVPQAVIREASGVNTTDEKNVGAEGWWRWIQAFILFLVASAVYYPSLTYPFQFDDLANISKKFEIRFFNWREHFFKYSRWVIEVLNRLTYQLGESFRLGGGGFDPFYYRIVNIAVHMLSGFMLCALLYRLLSRLTDDSFLKRNAWPISLTSAALFILHPAQTQTVSYIIQARLEGMATLFVLLSLWCVTVALQANSRLVYWASYLAALLFGFVSCGTKEIVIVLPFLSVLIDLFFIARGDVKQVLKRAVFHGVLAVIVFVALINYINPDFFMKIIGMKATVANNRGNMLNGSYASMITPWHFFISEFKVILHYLAIFFWPRGLSVEYDWKMVESFWALDCIVPGALLLGMSLGAAWMWWKNPRSMTAFSFAWFLIAVAPRSTFMPSPELICDYKTYLASIGVFVWMAVMLVHAYEWLVAQDFFSNTPTARQLQTNALGLACALGLGFATYERNLVWRTTVDLWLNIVENAPNKARAQNNAGVALSESGRYEEAIPYFVKAIMLDRQYADPCSNLAVCYSVKNDDKRAIQCLKEAVRLNPDYAEAWNNLGSLQINEGEYASAEQCLKNALILRPHYGKAAFNMGRVLMVQKKNDEAWTYFVRATQGDLDTSHAFDILGQIGIQMGKYQEAGVAFEEALKRSNGMYLPQTQFNLANSYFLTNRLSEAREIFAQLAQKHPEHHRFVYNLAETMFMQGDFKDAYPIFKSIAESDESLPNAPMRAAQCLEKQGAVKEAVEYVRTMLAETKSKQVVEILTPEKKRLEFAAHLKETGGVVNATDLQRLLGTSSSEGLSVA